MTVAMRCDHCGAPMRLVRDKDFFVCDYCTAFHFPEEESRDGVRVIAEATNRQCPVCHEDLVRGTIEGQQVLHCRNCRGVLVRRAVFGAILQRRRPKGPYQSRPLDREELKRQVRCPGCQQRMETHPYHGPGPMVIDTCGACALLWLDHGELDSIISAAASQPY